ncbi:MAG: DUF86 domain-containing protein [Planctomycetes bacterium]|nr:DUF86 domain-containing protein [Planctomycetota bacterium]
MRRDRLYLFDVIEAAKSVEGFVRGKTQVEFVGDDLLRSAVLHKLTIVGEAATRLSPELRERHPHVPWRDIVAFRNIAVHAYFAVDWAIVWVSATRELPELRRQVDAILDREFPEPAAPPPADPPSSQGR